MMPKLPEPDGYSPSWALDAPQFWWERSVRAIQEEAYKAGMAAAKRAVCPACAGMGTYDGDNGEIINPCDECDGTGFATGVK